MEPPLPAAAEDSGKPGRRSHRLWIVVAFGSVTDRISMFRETVNKYGSRKQFISCKSEKSLCVRGKKILIENCQCITRCFRSAHWSN